MFVLYKTAMFDVSTSDSVLLRRYRERVHSDTRQKDTPDLDPLHPLLKTPNSDGSCAKQELGPATAAKTGAVSLTLAWLAPTCRGYQRQNGKEGKRHAFKIVESGWKPGEADHRFR